MRARRHIDILRLLWFLIIFWGEAAVFRRTVGKCEWPDKGANVPQSRVMLVADPQVLDMQAYPDRPWALRLVSQVMVDLNLRRSWRATRSLRPHAVVFLGDMMDRGRADISDEEYDAYQRRFSSIFTQDDFVPTFFIPGNHDVGLGPHDQVSPYARHRYTSTFGPVPLSVQFGNHTLLFIDAPLLVDEERSPGPEASPALARIDQLASDASGPVILFTHVPLARPHGTDCGPLRERGTIRPGTGGGYQNTLSSEMSRALIQAVRPVVVFSGDDHDYCDTSAGGVRDVTVKSFSMAMGVRKPGFQLLTLSSGHGHSSYADLPCLLPDQLGIYLNLYVPLIILSLLILALFHVHRRTWGYGNHMREKSAPLPVPSVSGPRRGVKTSEVVGALVKDVGSIAWPPVLLFGIMAFWSSL